MARGPGIKLKGREKDRVLSEYMELLPSHHPTAAKLPGAASISIVLVSLSAVPLLIIGAANWFGLGHAVQFSAMAIGVVGLLVVTILLSTGLVGPRRRLWWAAMRKCGHDVCVICGYLLEGRKPGSDRCPECGTLDAEQPLPLGERKGEASWPRFEVAAPEEPTAPEPSSRE
ncbi:MAG: hypothetical protein KF724_10250 [Phycisphaeraceae bacterium]|nr:hypothetical protein [Phycisphaeraceae bacterium]